MCSFVTLPLETWVKDWVDKASGPRGPTHLCRSMKVLVSILSVFQLPPLASCSFLKITTLFCMTCAHRFCLPQMCLQFYHLFSTLPTFWHFQISGYCWTTLNFQIWVGGMPIQCSWFFIVVISSKLAAFCPTRFWPLVWLEQFCLGQDSICTGG